MFIKLLSSQEHSWVKLPSNDNILNKTSVDSFRFKLVNSFKYSILYLFYLDFYSWCSAGYLVIFTNNV